MSDESDRRQRQLEREHRSRTQKLPGTGQIAADVAVPTMATTARPLGRRRETATYGPQDELRSAGLPVELRNMLRQARLRAGLGYLRLELRTGIDRRHLSRIERGLRAPSIEVAGILARALNLEAPDTVWLLSEARDGVGRSWRPHAEPRSENR